VLGLPLLLWLSGAILDIGNNRLAVVEKPGT
jgi:hypothetical protein